MLVLVGTNHRSAPVSVRERVAYEEERIPEALTTLREQAGIEECWLLSTCNRVEVLVCSSIGPQRAVAAINETLFRARGLTREELASHSYHFVGSRAVEHLLQVTSGLDSMILGEPQVLGQVKRAYLLAKSTGTLGPVLERLLQHALSTGKRVRHGTGISRNAVSVAYAAVELARKIFGDLDGRSALLLGAGKMADLVARHLVSNGVTDLVVCSRRYARAVEAAERHQAVPVNWSDGLARVSTVDIVVSCTGSMRPILTRESVGATLRARRGQPLFLIDIAVPRDIEPAVNQLDNVYLYDIDGLNDVVDSNLEERRAAAEKARDIVKSEVEGFERWRQAQGVTPVIVALRERLLGTATKELERHRGQLSSMTEAQRRTVESIARGVVQKILHRPVRELKAAAERGEVDAYERIYHDLFDLGDPVQRASDDAGEAGESAEGQVGPIHLVKGGKDG